MGGRHARKEEQWEYTHFHQHAGQLHSKQLTNSDLLITSKSHVNQSVTQIGVRFQLSPQEYCEHAFIFSTDPNLLPLDHVRDKRIFAQRENMDRPASGDWGFRYCPSRNCVLERKKQVIDGSTLSDL